MIERIEGEPFDLLLKPSEIVTEGDDVPVSKRLDIEADNWMVDEMPDIVDGSTVGPFMQESGMTEMKLSGVQIQPDDDRYLLNAPIMIVREMIAKNDEDTRIHMGSVQIPHILDGCQFPPLGTDDGPAFPSFRSEPCFDMPKSVIRALYDGDIQKLDRLKKRINQFPGEFSVANHSPTYLAAFNGQEEEMTWVI